MTGQHRKVNSEDYVYDAFKGRLLNGFYSRRERITEEGVAREFSTTRTVVRKVFSKLEEESLLQKEAHKGVRVREISLREAMEIIDLRILLEKYAVSHFCETATTGDLERLRGILSSMKDALGKRDHGLYSRLNTQFHEVIYYGSGNNTLSSLLVNIKARLMRYQFKISYIPGRSEESFKEHYRIFLALEKRDALEAQRSVELHLESLRTIMLDNKELLEVNEVIVY
ncbi:MAG: GntR family transcriptional regulator [Thermoplasmatales archaeon]|nr:GntR family transcriptional regulator [Thermoplasmatales archaeon]